MCVASWNTVAGFWFLTAKAYSSVSFSFVYLMKTQSDIYDVFHQFFDDYYRKFRELPTMILMDNDPTHKSDKSCRQARNNH